MEEDERVQKLKAGKEKLAQFQKKKKKKKRTQHSHVAPEVLDVNVGETMDITSTLETLVAASPDYDSDQQSQSTCSEDETSTEEPSSRLFVHLKSQLQEKNQRVEELEESLAGKQLALDKVIRENEEFKKQTVNSREVLENGIQRENLAKSETSPCEHENQSVVSKSINQSSHCDGDQSVVKDAKSQQFELSDIQELLQHVQWLQLQLKQANGTLKLQNDRQQQTVGSLHQAREEVLNLQDNIEQKDHLLSQLAEKLTEISSQHESLKTSYQGLLEDKVGQEGQKIENELAKIKELLQNEYEDKLKKLKTDNQETVELLTEQFQEKITNATSELIEKVDQLETENIELKTDKDVYREQSEKLVTETETLKLQNESLAKGLEILKDEHENSIEKVEEVLKEKEHLEKECVQIKIVKDALQTELENSRSENEELGLLKNKLKTIQLDNENLEQMVQTLEEIKNENSSLLIENQNLADEVGKLKEDNLMYQTQLTEHEDKISQNGDIMEENLSLRVQNDELYNKINNQKDIIASLRGELELLTCENAQLVGQLKKHTEEEEKFKEEIKDLLQEKHELKSVVEDVKIQLEVVFAENVLHNNSIASLESEISKLKQNLDSEVSKDTATNFESDEPVSEVDVDEEVFPNAMKTTLKPIEEHFLMPETILPVEEEIVYSDNILQTNQLYSQNVQEVDKMEENGVQPNTDFENNIISQVEPEHQAMNDHTHNSDVPKSCDPVMSFTNYNQTEVNSLVCDDSAKSVSEANSKIKALQLQVQSLTEKLKEHRENSSNPADKAVQKDVLSSFVQTVDGNECGGCVLDGLNDMERTSSACHEDTAYQSISEHSDSQTVADLENDLRLKHQKIQTLQGDLDRVTMLLHEKQDECDNLQTEIEKLKDSSTGSPYDPGSNNEIVNDVTINLPSQQAVTEEVSELVIPSSLQTLEMEVNLHASSTPSQGGTFSIESSGVVGDVDREPRDQGQNSQNDIASFSLSSVKLDDVVASGVTVDDDGSKNVSDDGIKNTATNDHCDRKSRKDSDNQSKATSQLQQEIQSLQSSLEKSQQNNETVKHESEKIQWERDELIVKLQSVDNELEKMKAVICDKEFKQVKNEEDYVAVKERLEFLESTATDCFEMKEMLDKIQEEKENILKDNESLQCSLSAHIGENEQILKRLEALTVENQRLEKEAGVILSDVCILQENWKASEANKAEIESKLTETIERENRLAAENEGLLEENSTLKTKSHCLNADLEALREENIQLNSFFPDIDKKSDENRNLRLQQNTLETKISEISKENENLVEELMEQESKLTNVSEENEAWSTKCEQLQRIIEEMDDEKTGLLNTLEWSETNNTERIKQKETQVEKLEMQLCGLDEENSTLKTHILGLKQDLEEASNFQDNISQLREENEKLKSENAEFRDNMFTLEQDLLGLEEQTKSYEQTVASKSELTTSLKNDLSKILEENCSLKQKCKIFSHDLNDSKHQESLLKEQLKVYENCVSASESNSQELNSLSAQIELEIKYKTKLQGDLQKCQELLNVLEKDKVKLNDELSVAYKDVKNLQTTKQEDEKLINDLSTELETVRVEKEELMVEMTVLENEHQTVIENNKKLSQEVEKIQGHLQAVSENRSHIRNQTEVLVSEIEYLSICRDSLSSYVHNVRIKNNELLLENHELKRHNEELSTENDQLKTLNESNSVSDMNIEQSESKIKMEEQCAHLSKIVDNLNEQLGVSEREKQELENLTEDLTNMLRDMQTKYEEVKSEMESTKKTCDKEIGQLQTQLQVMNEDVSQLRKMLDLMENEMYHATEEKSILKENLEQQQAQYVVAVEEKQMLEEKLSEKNEKDRKNMATASKMNQMDSGATAAEIASANCDSIDQDSSINTSNGHNVFVPIREIETERSDVQMISNFSEEHTNVPSFQSALHFMDLQTPDSRFVNSSAQTNITVDINGHFGESSGNEKKEKCLETTATQTEICENGYQVINNCINQETIEWEECQTSTVDESMQIQVNSNDSNETDMKLFDSGSQTDFVPNQTVFCQTDIQDITDDEVSYSDKEHLHDFEKETDCSALEDTGEDISIVSRDSGVLTARMNTENEKMKVKAAKDCKEDAKTIHKDKCEGSIKAECTGETQAQTSDTDTAEPNVKSECIVLEAEKEYGINISEQSTISAKIRELEQTYDEKLKEMEAEVLKKTTEKLDFREKMIKAQKDNYDKKVKQLHYDLEEEYEFKFRQREAELMVEAESYKKKHAKEVEHAAELKIEKIRKEKDQQFVETLQKVKSDLTRRHGSRVPRTPDTDLCPAGDATGGEDGPQIDEDVRKLRIDNKDLASARDALLQKIDLSQQEQTAFHENLLSIMGDENSMKLSPQSSSQRMPAWLDWNLVPDISFDSVTSSIDARSLSGSLDPSSFCSNADCLSMRMRYEQLIEKIEQYLKLKPSISVEQDKEAVGVDDEIDAAVTDGHAGSIQFEDRFIESNEADSQVLERITSIHLEHFVRVPSEQTSTKQDQFVQESEGTEKGIETNENIIQAIVKEARSQAEYIGEGHFSENESDNEDSGNIENNDVSLDQASRGHFIPTGQSQFISKNDEGHFCDDTDNDDNNPNMYNMNVRRHFSESDVQHNKETKLDIKTSQSDKVEGHFVQEKSLRAIVGKNIDDPEVFDSKTADDVFESISSKKTKGAKRGRKSKKKEQSRSEKDSSESGLMTNRFIAEASVVAEKCSGTDEACIVPADSRDTHTGEGTGDFIEEKMIKIEHVSNLNSEKPSFFSDSIVVEKQSLSLDDDTRVESGDILKAISQEVEAQDNKFEPPAERTTSPDFVVEPEVKSVPLKSRKNDTYKKKTKSSKDIPGETETESRELTDARQNLSADFSSMQPQFSTGKQSYENTVFDILNSICPGTDPSRIRGEFHPAVNQFEATADEFSELPSEIDELKELKKENEAIKAALKKAKVDKENLEREIVDKEIVLQELKMERSLPQSGKHIIDDKSKDFEQLCKLNQKLTEESAKIKADRDRLECKVNELSSTIEMTEDNLEQARQAIDDISCKLANSEAGFTEIETVMKELQNEKEELTKIKEFLNINIQKFHEENAQLIALKDALEKENFHLQEKSLKCANLENEIAKVMGDISILKSEKETLTEEFELEREKLEKEKVEVENVLIAQADMYEKLVEEKKHIEENVIPKIKELEKHIDCLQSQNEEITTKFETEKQLTDQLMAKENELNDEVFSLKTTKNELNSVIARLTSEVQEVQNSLQQKIEEICKLEQEKDMMNDTLKEYSNMSEQRSEMLKEKEVQLDETIKENKRNECTITALQNETSNLNSTIKELTEKMIGLVKSNGDLKAREEQSEQNRTQVDRTLDEQDRLLLQVQHLEDERHKWIMGCKELAQMLNCFVKEADDQKSNETHNKPSEKEDRQLDGEKDTLAEVMNDEKRIPEVLEDLTFKVTALITENDSLKKDGHELKNQNEDQLRGLVEERHLLLEQTQHLKDLNSESERNVEELNEKVKTLVAEKEHLMKELSDMKERNTEDEWAIKELVSQIEAQEVEKQNFEKNKTDLQRDKDNIQAVNLELEKLKEENIALTTRLENLENNSDTENDVQILQELKEALKLLQDEKSALECELGDKSEKFERENLMLSIEVEKLQEVNDSLKKKHKSQEETLKKENADILKMYSDLRNEVEVLVISKHDLEIELHALKDLLEHESESGDTSQLASCDSSRELTIQDLEEMEDLKNSIEKLKSDLKEKDSYVRKLEEHLLNINRGLPELTSNPKPTSSRGEPVLSRRYTRKRPMWLEYGRRAMSHDLPSDAIERSKHESHNERSPSLSVSTTETEGSFEHSVLSEQQFVASLNEESKFKSSVCSETRSCSTLSESFDVTEKVKSGLSAKEDGHVALEQKQFELVEEITTLRRDFRETKALYAQEAALLSEALEKEKAKKDMLELSRERNKSGSATAHDLLRSKLEIDRLKEENKMLKLESERWLSRMKDQEQVVLELKEKISRNTSGIEEIEEVFGRQLALLQKQREELVEKLKERDIENYKLSTSLGEKGIIEETLRREKEVLRAKLQEKEDLESELNEYKVHFEKQICKQKQLEETVNQKDHSEMQLMKQKRILEEELHEIESKFKDREGTLESEKNRLLDELRDRRSVHISTYITEGDDDTKSLCTAGAYLTDNNNIGRIEKMLEDVEKEHSQAVRILRDQLKSKYSRREQMLREEQAEGMKKLKGKTEEQVK